LAMSLSTPVSPPKSERYHLKMLDNATVWFATANRLRLGSFRTLWVRD